MKLEELLRHVANNVENGLPAGYGLLFQGERCAKKNVYNLRLDQPSWYTLAPSEVLVNNKVVELGVIRVPQRGTTYFSPSVSEDKSIISTIWWNTCYDRSRFKKGLVFLDRSKAVVMANALFNFEKIE